MKYETMPFVEGDADYRWKTANPDTPWVDANCRRQGQQNGRSKYALALSIWEDDLNCVARKV